MDLEKINTKDPDEFWRSIKNMGRKSKKDIPLEVYDDENNILFELDDVLGKWGTEFGSLFSNTEIDDEQQRFCEEIATRNRQFEAELVHDSNSMLNEPFTFTEVRKIITVGKNNKAPGLDGIVHEVLKNTTCMRLLLELFNRCLESGLLPSPWLKAVIKPIPKNPKSDPRVPLNYRGISLLPTIAKIYSALLSGRVGRFLESSGKLVNEQNGFRPNRSCVDHIFALSDLLRIRKANNEETFCSFFDFQKAFYCVNHELLLYKLWTNGITGNIYNVIKAIYSKPESCVNINGHLTNWFPVRSGVRQGDTLSPTLFALFINDLVLDINESRTGVPISYGTDMISALLYADDIVFIAPSHSQGQDQLDILSSWCGRWCMRINPSKSQVIHVRNHQRRQCTIPLYACNQQLEYVSDYKYLGCWINEFVSNEKTVETLTSAAGRSFGRIINIFKSMGDMGYETYSTLYRSYVLPVANYGAGVWGFKNYPAPQVLQNRIERFFLGVHRFAPLAATWIEMDWLDMCRLRKLDMFRLMNRLAGMDESRIPKMILRWDIINGCCGWMGEILKVCQELDIPSPIGPYMSFYRYESDMLERKFMKCCREEWRGIAPDKPKLISYVQIRDMCEYSCLVNLNLPRYQRSVIARLLCGILPLEIEVGRYKRKNGKKIPREERYCKVCNSQDVENEVHFVLTCDKLKGTRDEYIKPLLDSDPENENRTKTEKLKWLLSREVLPNSALGIELLYRERQSIIYKPKAVK